MRILLLPAAILIFTWSMSSCKSSAPPSFCDTACLKDSLKFTDDTHPLKPYVYISAANCNADSVTWSYTDMGNNRKLAVTDFTGNAVKLNKSAVGCFIRDTTYAWLTFNDCSDGRGYAVKIPFNKRDKISTKSSAINKFDPKFSVADGLLAYSDRGNLFVEEMATGKQAMATFGERVEIDYSRVHDFIDSVHITPTHLWVKVKLEKGWKEIDRKIELK